MYAEREGGLFILIVTDRTRTLAQRLSSRLNREIYNLKSDDVCRVIGGGGVVVVATVVIIIFVK